MKLTIGDRIKHNDSIYTVEAVLFSTVYLRTEKQSTSSYGYDYALEEVYKTYRDIEFISGEGL